MTDELLLAASPYASPCLESEFLRLHQYRHKAL